MFKKDDKVSHPGHGACKIKDICQQDFMGEKKDYYELVPMVDQNSTLYVPIDTAEEIGIRSIISKKEANTLLETLRNATEGWVAETNAKQRRFKELFAENTKEKMHESMTAMSALVRQSEERPLGNIDKNILRKIQEKTMSEIALAKGISLEAMLEKAEGLILDGKEEEATA